MVEEVELVGEWKREMEQEFKRDLEKGESFIVEGQEKIGKGEIERLKQKGKKMKEGMIIGEQDRKIRGREV